MGTPTAVAAKPIALRAGVLFFAPFTGAELLRSDPPEHLVIHYRAHYGQEIQAMIDALVSKAGVGIDEIAFFTQRDAYGDSGFKSGIAALRRHGEIDDLDVIHVRYERNTLLVERAVAELLLSPHRPRAVIMVGTYAPCAKFVRLALDSELRTVFLSVSFVGSTSLAHELREEHAPLVVTQVVPHPNDLSLPIVREYRADRARFGSSTSASFVSLEGYIAARILGLAARNLPPTPTRADLVLALEQLGEFDLGLGQPLSLGPEDHQASDRVWPTQLVEGEFVPFEWTDLRRMVDELATPQR